MLKKSLTILGLLMALSWCIWCLLPAYVRHPGFYAWMLNVGQGESVLLRDPGGETVLFDGGPDDSVMAELGSILQPWQRRIDLLVLSHDHSDHVTGFIPILQRYKVKEVWISGALAPNSEYKTFREELKKHGLSPVIRYFNAASCQPGLPCPPIERRGSFSLQIYHPIKDMEGIEPKDQHDATLVLKAAYAGHTILLPGDLNEQQERDILNSCHPPACSLKADILQEPHHGSATGLNPAFLKAVSPAAVLIPVGANNKFHHPSPIILTRLKEAKLRYFRTDVQGRIQVIFTKKGPAITTQR